MSDSESGKEADNLPAELIVHEAAIHLAKLVF